MRLSRDTIVWLVLLLACLILLLGSEEQRLRKASLLGRTFYYPFLSSVNHIEELIKAKKRNEELSQILSSTILKFHELETDLATLKRTLQIQDNQPWEPEVNYDFRIASVISYRGNFTNRLLIINEGSNKQIKENYPVFSEKGIVGKVITVYPNHSIILPINNSLFKLGVITEQNNIQGLLEADNYGNVYMSLLSSGAQVNTGDVVVTSMASKIFPRGFPVGKVSKLVKNPEDIYMKAIITPYAEINNLEQVSVLFYQKELPDEQ